MKGTEDIWTDFLMGTAVDAVLRGNYTSAIGRLERLLTINPELSDARVLLGQIYARQARYEEAIKQWQEVLKKEPDNSEVKEAIRKAEGFKTIRDRGSFYRRNVQRRFLIGVVGILFMVLIGGYLTIPSVSDPQPEQVVYRVERMEVGSFIEKSPIQTEPTETEKTMIDTEEICSAIKEDKTLSFLSITFRAENDKLFVYGRIPTLYLYERLIEFLRRFPGVKAIDTTGIRITGLYVVEKNEILQTIARKLYGSSHRWEDVFRVNKEKLSSPDRIYYEMELKVPFR